MDGWAGVWLTYAPSQAPASCRKSRSSSCGLQTPHTTHTTNIRDGHDNVHACCRDVTYRRCCPPAGLDGRDRCRCVLVLDYHRLGGHAAEEPIRRVTRTSAPPLRRQTQRGLRGATHTATRRGVRGRRTVHGATRMRSGWAAAPHPLPTRPQNARRRLCHPARERCGMDFASTGRFRVWRR